MKQQKAYGNESISSLKGADRVRLRPAVIFGSDGLEGCEHAVFEILSNAIDEAREGYGKQILVTRFADHSIEVEDFGRGCPVDWNEKEGRYNWELVFCELYAGGKYQNNTGGDYEFSLGLNGLGSCATQYSSEYFDATIRRDGYKYSLHFEKGELVGKMKKEPTDRKATGSVFRWKPDLPFSNHCVLFLKLLALSSVVKRGTLAISFVSSVQRILSFRYQFEIFVLFLNGQYTLAVFNITL